MEPPLPDLPTGAVRRDDLAHLLRDSPSWTVTPRQLGDLELLMTGAYAPLERFMTQADAEACSREMRLADGTPFPVPILLDVSEACAQRAAAAGTLVLRDPEGVPLALLEVRDSWYGSAHCLGGPITACQLPTHHDSMRVRLTPDGVAAEARRRNWPAAVAFASRQALRRGEHQATRDFLEQADAGVVIMALADPSEDVAQRSKRVRAIEAVLPGYAADRALVWLVPLGHRPNRLDETLLSAVAARNAGCTRLIVTERFERPADEAKLAAFAGQIGMAVVHAPAPPDADAGPESAEALSPTHRPGHRTGFTVFFTGLSGSGKSTIANLVRVALVERTGRPVTLLDGDLVRQHLSSELGFSREHRDLNIRRIAFVASEITRHGGMAICAPIAPYDSVRREARASIEACGGFVLVYVDTPLEVCEARDRKGLYAKARAGLIPEFTGVSDPYEPPGDADVIVRTSEESAEDAARRIVRHLEARGFLPADGA